MFKIAYNQNINESFQKEEKKKNFFSKNQANASMHLISHALD